MMALNSSPEPLSLCGEARYEEEDYASGSKQLSVHVTISLKGRDRIVTLARLDAAIPWAVLDQELNKRLGIEQKSDEIHLQTAAGRMAGSLVSHSMTFLADTGDPPEVEATMFGCDDWQRGDFSGYRGFLQRMRFAVDPGNRMFHFGPCP